MTTLVKGYAFRLKHQPLKIRFVKDDSAGRNRAARINHTMPGDISFVVRRCVHSPSDEPCAVLSLEQIRDLSIGHHPPSRNSQHEPIDLLKSFFESRGR